MGVVIPAGFAQIILQYSLDDSSHQSSTQFACEFSGSLGDLADGIAGAWQPNMLDTDLLSGHWTGVKVTANTATESIDSSVIAAGDGGFEPIASNCCVLAKKRTGMRGRANNGRMFLPAGYCDEADTAANGKMGDDLVGALQAMIDAFAGDVAGVAGFIEPVILHSGVGVPTPFDSFQIEAFVATQRRRMPRS